MLELTKLAIILETQKLENVICVEEVESYLESFWILVRQS